MLFPPLTALEVCGSRVEGAVLVVELRPSVKQPGGVRTGPEDIARYERERMEEELRANASRLELERVKTEAKQQQALSQRQKLWRERMHEVRHLANRKLIAEKSMELAETELKLKRAVISTRWAKGAGRGDSSEQEEMDKALKQAEAKLKAATEAQKIAEKKAAAAVAKEKKANQEKEKMEKKLGEQSNKISAMYGQAQFMRGVLRAKEAASIKQGMDPNAEAPEEVDNGKEYGPIEKAAVGEVAERLRLVVGPKEQWAIEGVKVNDVSMGEQCCERIFELCNKRSKDRKAAVAAGAVEALAELLRKYSDQSGLQPQVALSYKACLALGAITKKAESEELQTPTSACLHALVPCLDFLMKPAVNDSDDCHIPCPCSTPPELSRYCSAHTLLTCCYNIALLCSWRPSKT